MYITVLVKSSYNISKLQYVDTNIQNVNCCTLYSFGAQLKTFIYSFIRVTKKKIILVYMTYVILQFLVSFVNFERIYLEFQVVFHNEIFVFKKPFIFIPRKKLFTMIHRHEDEKIRIVQ